ncbi:hypothetical protein VULLAG_LOCUS20246 [Vulpes lagopus]
MKDPAGGVCEEEAEEEGGKTEEERSPRGGCVRGEGEPRAASGDPALPRGRDAGPWEGGRDLAEIACSRPQLNPRLLPAFPGQGIFFPRSAPLTPAATFLEKDHTCAYSRSGGEVPP